MNHLSVFLGIVTGVFLGGSFFGASLMLQALTIITGLSLWVLIVYCLISLFK